MGKKLKLNKAQRLTLLRSLRLVFQLLSVLSTLTVSLVQFKFIEDNILKCIIYIVLCISVLGTSGPLILSRLPERVKAMNIRRTIINTLDVACLNFTHEYPAKYRACVFMLPRKDSKVIKIEYNSQNMDDAPDNEIKLEKWQGCTGTAWGESRPVVADLTLPEQEGGPKWRLTDEQKKLTEKLSAVLSVPIYHPIQNTHIIAILSFDSEEPVADFFFQDSTQDLAAIFTSIFAELICMIESPISL